LHCATGAADGPELDQADSGDGEGGAELIRRIVPTWAHVSAPRNSGRGDALTSMVRQRLSVTFGAMRPPTFGMRTSRADSLAALGGKEIDERAFSAAVERFDAAVQHRDAAITLAVLRAAMGSRVPERHARPGFAKRTSVEGIGDAVHGRFHTSPAPQCRAPADR
jgi:hypothetical protein